MINLTVERMFCGTDYTIGRLSVNNEYFCDTLEDRIRDLNHDGDLEDEGETKIYGDTAIPFGRYRIDVTWSPKFNRDLPILLNVKHFTGIRIHRGLTAKNTKGCILVGENTEVGKVTNGGYWEPKLTEILQGYLLQGEEIYINMT